MKLHLLFAFTLLVLCNMLVRGCLSAFISFLSHSNTSVGSPRRRRRRQTQQIIYPNRLFCASAPLVFQRSFTCKFTTNARASRALQSSAALISASSAKPLVVHTIATQRRRRIHTHREDEGSISIKEAKERKRRRTDFK